MPAEPVSDVPGYQSVRLGDVPERARVWSHVISYLDPWIDTNHAVLEIGAGPGDVIGQIDAVRRVAIDSDPTAGALHLDDVEGITADARDMPMLGDHSIGTVIASNVVEHLDADDAKTCIVECARVLRPGGHLVIVQPNFRLCAKQYFDDYTHRSVFTDTSLADLVTVSGFKVVRKEPRFLPLTVKSRLRHGHRLVPLYLASPWRPLAGQMLVIGQRQP
jgi:SAM-dependent methyltransferase